MAIVVERKPLSWAEKTYLPQILVGLKTTLVNMFRPSVTLEYPEQRPLLPQKYRGVPALVKNPQGRIKCVACQLCEFVCPPKAIRITPSEIGSEDPSVNIEKRPKTFDIDMLRCIYCGLCEEVCPEEAIFLQPVYSLNSYKREGLVFNKEKLLEIGGVHLDRHQKWEKKRLAELEGPEHH